MEHKSRSKTKKISVRSINFPITNQDCVSSSDITIPEPKSRLKTPHLTIQPISHTLITQAVPERKATLPHIDQSHRTHSQDVTDSPYKILDKTFHKPDIDLKIHKLYNKVFCGDHKKILSQRKADHYLVNSYDYKLPEVDPYIIKRVKSVKEKIVFIKNVYDYVYPCVMVEKLKTLKEIMARSKEKISQKEAQRLRSKEMGKMKVVVQDTNAFPETTRRNRSIDEIMKAPVIYHPLSSVFLSEKHKPQTRLKIKIKKKNSILV
jgi:hypothetical protein